MTESPSPSPFGTLLGVAPGGVPVYSSDYASANDDELPDRSSYRNYVDGIFMGYKWQCVEFARRWLYHNRGCVFGNVAMAYDIFSLRSLRAVADDALLPLCAFRNGSSRLPEPGCLLIWDEGGEFEDTGHVAIVTEVLPQAVRFVEQNYEHVPWPERQAYSRELKVERDAGGGYHIRCAHPASRLLGWMMQTDDDTGADTIAEVDPHLLDALPAEAPSTPPLRVQWLDESKPEIAAYVFDMEGHRLSMNDADRHRYFGLSESALREIKHAANELHAMFMHATHHVMEDDARLARFNIPRALWPKIHQSWNNRRTHMITGRLDLSVSARGIKVYEYNADSASCYLECGNIQREWARHYGVADGRDAGEDLFADLCAAWRVSGVDGDIHIMLDDDPEERYHALYMKAAIEQAGLSCRLLDGLAGLTWDDGGAVVDRDGRPIRWVWKTWAWETAFEEIRAQLEGGENDKVTVAPRLADVLLRQGVMVFEPLWTAIPSNKAILPVLCELFPDHPNLLETRYELSDDLRARGYAVKPIGGRCGSNVAVVNRHDDVVAATEGRFDNQPHIYQELFPLPRIGDYYVQHSAFVVDGHYSATCVRVDPGLVITGDSDVLAVRVLGDSLWRGGA
ncbi:MAG: glutathionylspermidine synthase family protein [Gammaproteobacteria bacterium]